ncbi:polyprenyl diphosphate synthase [Streptomyces sp. NBC_01500]|uniref:polyprenyl diphosphate synthase n=1 Tax=Streptomyces sp. NBC_01500 TaxID=2903886 RepID=UPI00225091E3|nr:polyprenyl diphosphate synthase [Streptomyces sp. NBC_01500]MCX4548663.1 polyprenyl diphosphate synthase [Streptomyces sp. NBC_01500]
MPENEASFIDSPELSASYAWCAAEIRQFLTPMWKAAEVLPAGLRPHVLAVCGFTVHSDRIADEGGTQQVRAERLARWRSDTLEELRTGRSGHPSRRAFVDTVQRWDIGHALVEEFLDTLQDDCASPPFFETFAEQRRYLRGVAGTSNEMWMSLLDPTGPEALALASVLGEVCQLVDTFEDLPIDLAAGRCYLPRADLRQLGLKVGDLRSGEQPDVLDELVDIQLGRWRDLLEQAMPVAEMVRPECRPFLHTMLLGSWMQFDEVTLRKSRVFADGMEPLTSTGAEQRRPPWPVVNGAPAHVGVIMDGNRRWATRQTLPVSRGYQAGGQAAMRLVNAALRLGVRHLSIYAFSTENWDRSQEELAVLFDTMADGITQGTEWLHERGVCVRWCGRRDRIDTSLASALTLMESLTSNNDVLTLTLCVDYGGRDELTRAARALAAEAVAGTIRPEDIGPADLARNMYTPGLPDVDLLIRTSGEQRISNFLPWHLAYAELVFDPTPWPDFGLAQLREALATYAGRQRRFGGSLPGPARPVVPVPAP